MKHRNRTLAALAVTGAAAATLAGQASAHPASVSCGPDGPVVTAPAYHGASASVTTAGGIATVTWSDGYTLTLALPAGCVAPPVTPPAVPVPVPVPPEVTPPTTVARVTCAELVARHAGVRWYRVLGCTPPKPRKVTCAWLRAHHAGPRSYTRLGHYYLCKTPVQRRVVPPVAG